MHRHRDVGEDRRRPHGRDRDALLPVAVGERVADRDERVVHVHVLDLEVGDRRLVERAPVDDPVGAVDPPAIPEMGEEREDGPDVRLVHREALARVVERGAEAPVLAHDRAPRLLQPLPRARDERLSAEIVPRQPLLRELLLDDVLRRDARVVVARLPERVVALHPVPADEDVLQRPVQGVAHVEIAGDVRRRNADHERVVAARTGAGRVQALVLPGRLPALLDAFGRYSVSIGEESTAALRGVPASPSARPSAARIPGTSGGLSRRAAPGQVSARRRRGRGSCSCRGRRACPPRPRLAPRSSRPCGQGGRRCPCSGRRRSRS